MSVDFYHDDYYGEKMGLLQLLMVLLNVLLLGIGQILFKKSAAAASTSGHNWFISIINPTTFLALVVYGIATLVWMYVLKTTPLSVAYPFVGAAFIVVPVLAWAVLGESFSIWTLAGVSIIALGIWVSSINS
jgi:undecaprenyl phosphate-alpha-L-ara4N flippase subunit ArnE